MVSDGNSNFKMTMLFEVFHAFYLMLRRVKIRYAGCLSHMVFINKEYRCFFLEEIGKYSSLKFSGYILDTARMYNHLHT